MGIFGTAGPIVFIILVEFLNASILPCQSRKSSCRKFAVCLFHGISLFALGISLTLCLTEIGKRWVGRLRPHFISVCNPNLNVLNCSTSSVSGVYYNPSVLLEKDLLIKYGVVSERDFINHMTRWENLFIAGRFHKPVIPIFKEDDNIKEIINKNRDAAVNIF